MSTRRAPARRTIAGPVGELSYLHWTGEREQIPILCLHPVNTAAAVWTDVAARLPDREIVAVDYRGHGHSAPGGPYFPDDYARDALALLAELGFGKVHLVGGSIGGAVAVEFTTAHRDAVASIALFGATLHLGLTDDELDPMVKSLRELGVRRWFEVHGGEILGPRSAQSAAGTLVRLAEGGDDKRTVESVVDILVTTFGRADSRPAALTLAAAESVPPAFVAVGTSDPTCPPDMAADLGRYLSTEVTLMDGVGHLPMLETPGATAALLKTFLADVESMDIEPRKGAVP